MDKRFEESDKTNSSSSSSQIIGIPDNNVLNTISTNSITYQTYLKSETNLDNTASQNSLQTQSELLSLDP